MAILGLSITPPAPSPKAVDPASLSTVVDSVLLACFLPLFFASGFTALLYQVIWQRLLTIFSGADLYSTTMIVSAFMAGLGCGSLAGGYLADRVPRHARIALFA